MLVYAKTDESDVGRIRVGVDASFKVDSFPQETFRGRVTQVRMNAYQVQNVVTYDTIIEFENPDVKLLPGMTAYVTIPVATARDVIKIPNGALRFKPEMPDEQRRALLAKYGLLGPAASPGGDGAGTVRAQERSGGDNAGPGAGQGGGQGGGGQGGNEEERARRRERFQQMSPEERAQARAHRQGMREGGGGGGQSFQGPGVESASQILWKLLPNNTLQPVRVKTGVTDFTVTAMLEGDIQPGDKFVIGQTMSGRASSSPVGGMPRRF